MNAKATGKTVYLVMNAATFGGGAFRGNSPYDAARRAAKHSLLRGAENLLVKSFAGGPIGQWTFSKKELS